ncbi:MAG TPA: hypothetical protein VLV45_09885 [Gemmatimonadales bacterium]|nr:hypothetical protein [Gemmatimonadales bacterium]
MRPIVVLAAPLTLACHSLRPVSPTQLNPVHAHNRVWVTGLDHSVVELQDPEVNHDTLNGIVDGEPQRIALDDVVIIQALQSDPAKTAVVAIIAGGATFAGLWYMEHRPDVGDVGVCTNGILDMGVAPGSQYIPCCQIENTTPC